MSFFTKTKNKILNNKKFSILCVLVVLLFIFLRLFYWSHTSEPYFSDTASYQLTAKTVYQDFSFSGKETFWKTYRAPTLPMLRAFQMHITGLSIFSWQIFETLLLLVSAFWLCFEIFKITNNKFLFPLFIFLIAVSKSSIFWSLKLSTESLSEMFIYLSLAATFFALRTQKTFAFLVLGVIFALSFLNTSQTFVLVPLFCISYLLTEIFYRSQKLPKILKNIMFLVLGVLLIWTPWLGRSYAMYGGVIPFHSHSALSFFWEMPNQVVEINGKKITVNAVDMGKGEHKVFKNEYEAYVYEQSLVKEWVRENWVIYPKLYVNRLSNSLTSFYVKLTVASRTQIIPEPWNFLLLDKNFLVLILGLIGLFVIPLYYNKKFFYFLLFFAPYFAAMLFIGNPRILDPYLPLIFFLATVAIWIIIRPLVRGDNSFLLKD